MIKIFLILGDFQPPYRAGGSVHDVTTDKKYMLLYDFYPKFVYFSSSGLNLAIFRDEKGEAHVLDAYCPHLGAHIGVGGRVVGDCLQCPFHGWEFRGSDGKVTKIPYADKGKFSVFTHIKTNRISHSK